MDTSYWHKDSVWVALSNHILYVAMSGSARPLIICNGEKRIERGGTFGIGQCSHSLDAQWDFGDLVE